MAASLEDPELESSVAILDQEIEAIEKERDRIRESISETLDDVSDILCRTILRLRFLHGFSWKEVGFYTNLSEQSAKAAAYRALNKHIPK